MIPLMPPARALWLTDMRAMLDASQEHCFGEVFDFILLSIVTCARPGSVLALTSDRLDHPRGLIHLHRAGTRPRLVHRHVVRIPHMIGDLMPGSDNGPLIQNASGEPVRSINGAWCSVRRRVGLGTHVVPSSVRATMVRWLMQQNIPLCEIAVQLGHATPARVGLDPRANRYLDHAEAAINAYLRALFVAQYHEHLRTAASRNITALML